MQREIEDTLNNQNSSKMFDLLCHAQISGYVEEVPSWVVSFDYSIGCNTMVDIFKMTIPLASQAEIRFAGPKVRSTSLAIVIHRYR